MVVGGTNTHASTYEYSYAPQACSSSPEPGLLATSTRLPFALGTRREQEGGAQRERGREDGHDSGTCRACWVVRRVSQIGWVGVRQFCCATVEGHGAGWARRWWERADEECHNEPVGNSELRMGSVSAGRPRKPFAVLTKYGHLGNFGEGRAICPVDWGVPVWAAIFPGYLGPWPWAHQNHVPFKFKDAQESRAGQASMAGKESSDHGCRSAPTALSSYRGTK